MLQWKNYFDNIRLAGRTTGGFWPVAAARVSEFVFVAIGYPEFQSKSQLLHLGRFVWKNDHATFFRNIFWFEIGVAL